MKTTTSLKIITLATVLGAALTTSVWAQTGPGPGPAPGVVPLMQGAGPGAGMGPGAHGMRNMRFDRANTPGWTLMTAQERTANQNRMREVMTYEECKMVQAEQHQMMQARAKEKGVTLTAPRQNACDNMKARGFIKQ